MCECVCVVCVCVCVCGVCVCVCVCGVCVCVLGGSGVMVVCECVFPSGTAAIPQAIIIPTCSTQNTCTYHAQTHF